MRPVLKPALRRLWRDDTTLQFGVDATRAVVLAGLDPPAAELLELLDGTRDVDRARAEASYAGLTPDRADRLIDLLADARVLDDGSAIGHVLAIPAAERARLVPDLASLSLVHSAPGAAADVLARRRAAAIRVEGAGRVGAPLAALLAAGGVGIVDVHDDATSSEADAAPGGIALDERGTSRAAAARRAIERVAPSTGVDAGVHTDLVVSAGALPSAPRTDVLMACGVPHLAVLVRETTAIVGPLVLPGRSSCLRCLDLTRTDRDPAWPLLVAQLSRPGARRTVEPCDVTLAVFAAVLGVMQALAFLDGGSAPTIDGTLELTLPDWRLRRRSWAPHPACGCVPHAG